MRTNVAKVEKSISFSGPSNWTQLQVAFAVVRISYYNTVLVFGKHLAFYPVFYNEDRYVRTMGIYDVLQIILIRHTSVASGYEKRTKCLGPFTYLISAPSNCGGQIAHPWVRNCLNHFYFQAELSYHTNISLY